MRAYWVAGSEAGHGEAGEIAAKFPAARERAGNFSLHPESKTRQLKQAPGAGDQHDENGSTFDQRVLAEFGP
jgi:hypothetical protein